MSWFREERAFNSGVLGRHYYPERLFLGQTGILLLGQPIDRARIFRGNWQRCPIAVSGRMHDGGRAKDALAMLTDLAQSDPTNFDAQMGIGAAAKLAGNYQLAFEAFRRTGK